MIRFRIVLLFLLVAAESAMAIEEPSFEVLHVADDYEVRRYAPFIVAEVDVEGPMDDAGGTAFRILAGYIFGDNEPRVKMAMTAPVSTRPAGDGERMRMTAPVLSEPASAERDAYTFAFVMESKYSMDTLPQPLDSRIRLVEKPARVIVARRYSGSWSEKKYLANKAKLLAALEADGVEVAGMPYFARYNSPFAPWFLRRNEVLVEVSWPPANDR